MAITQSQSEKVQAQVKRLNELRKKSEEFAATKQRLTGELDGCRRQIADIEAKCQADFGCEIDKLPTLMAETETAINKSLEEAAAILGVS